MKKYIVKLNGKEYEVEIEEAQAGAVPQANEPHESSLPPQISDGGEVIIAPLPGVVLDMKVSSGDSVMKGQVLAILEAMKLENEIVAPIDGVVSIISVSKGQTVQTGDAMMQIS